MSMGLGRVAALLGLAVVLTVGAAALIELTPQPPDLQADTVHSTCSTAGTSVVLPVAQQVTPSGILGTGSEDLQGFATKYNDIRIANCLSTVPTANFRLGACIEERLIWIAEDPSEDPLSAWGHDGTERSDGEPPVGCDANLAGGPTTTGTVAAEKWWISEPHRVSLYRPEYGGPVDNVCVDFAMTHGGLPDESASFARAGAVWGDCEHYRDQVERRP